MDQTFKTVASSNITISELMLPSHTNFSGKIHGGYILSLLDQIAFACASKFSGNYCVTASVDTVNFLKPIEVGELVTMKASVNYVGKSSMIVGIRVEAENIQTGKIKHCNSSYFTMVAKNSTGESVTVPGLILSNQNDLRRYFNCVKQIALKKEKDLHEEVFDHNSPAAIASLDGHNVKLNIKLH
ncbi:MULTISPECIES: acyl-CoA thioesterase [unclassified Flavobacterium]|uniref:acyl-CoA thioesterase n=1 Tax=unclassified Flavobacterium TaxID=196869 RepID=UPI00131BB46A|nr:MULTISPECIES: acyl-CoA thioesterase [unclassified Flavobacterium]